MRPQPILIPAILLLFLASCSHTGIFKSSSSQDAASKKTAEATQKPSEISQSEDEGVFHIVGRDETLEHICSVYNLDQKKVASLNALKPPYTLEPGDTVFLHAQALLPDKEEPKKTASTADKSQWQEPAGRHKAHSFSKTIRGKRDPSVPILAFPVPGGELSSPFGHRWGVFHKGLDIAAPIGTPVLACLEGRVLFTGVPKFKNYGKTILLDHGNGIYTQYAHLNQILVKKGQKVKRAQKIALVGNTGRSTGPHLHIEVRARNKLYNPLAYFSPQQLKSIRVAKRFSDSPMGPVPAQWGIPELLTAKR
ncbi:MAG: peptidoglycan DD-metalloendopeptidase family protein [Thermodesulfobacteriota bacterium]